MEHLELAATNREGEVFCCNRPSRSIISNPAKDLMDVVNELTKRVQELERPKWKSGYLKSKFG